MEDDIKIIQGLELKLLTVEGRTDADFLSSVLSDDFQECGASGRVFGKNDVINRLPSEDNSFTFTATEMSTRFVTSDVAINNFNAEISKYGNSSQSYRMSVWKRTSDSWVMVYHQGTPLPKT